MCEVAGVAVYLNYQANLRKSEVQPVAAVWAPPDLCLRLGKVEGAQQPGHPAFQHARVRRADHAAGPQASQEKRTASVATKLGGAGDGLDEPRPWYQLVRQ